MAAAATDRVSAFGNWNCSGRPARHQQVEQIEHRLFSFISKNWRGQPRTSFKVIVSLIAATTARKGLKAHAGLDRGTYLSGIKIADGEMSKINRPPEA